MSGKLTLALLAVSCGSEVECPVFDVRNPDTGECVAFEYAGDCGAAVDVPSLARCDTDCEALAETACMAEAGCRAVYAGSVFYACWAAAEPVRHEGACADLDVYTCLLHDNCRAMHASEVPLGGFMQCADEP